VSTVGAEGVTTNFIKSVFGSTSEAPVFVCSLPNEDAPPDKERKVSTRDLSDIVRFVAKWDRKGRSLYFCVGTINGGHRNKESVAETVCLHADIDLKDISESRADVEKVLTNLELPPSIVVFSGNGLHAYWLFKEASIGERDRIESALKLLADLLAGDRAVTHPAALMRLPGSHNTKRDAWTDVEVLTLSERRYELDDLEEWLARSSPKILRKERPRSQPSAEDNPFLKAAADLSFKPSIDVEKRLSLMMYMGGGDASIHSTQLAVSASLLNAGHEIEEVVDIIKAATQAAAGPYGANWNWRKEEKNIRTMCQTWRKKHPITSQSPPITTPAKPQPAMPSPTSGGQATAAVVNLAEARAAKTKPAKKKKEGAEATTVVADGVIEAIRQAGQDILLSEGEVWIYAQGIWHVMTPADQQWIMTLIQEGFETLNEPLKTTSLNASYKRICEHPKLYKREVEWADGGVVVCQNGVLNLATKQFGQHSPQHYARRKIGAGYKPGENCPKFVSLLTSMFADREDATEFAQLIQAWAGAALAIGQLSREERKALILVGPSRTGKTELSRIIRLLIGDPIATPSVAEISERFGLSSLYDAAAWIRDDAINEGDDLDPQRFKTIVTGEPIDIERKHKPAVSGVELALPVLLTTNSLPKARDKSDAIFNRSLVLEMTNIVSEQSAHDMRQSLGVPKGSSIGQFIFNNESAGILNWALEGLSNLVERGSYDIPESVRTAIQRFKDDNNPVGEWARTAIVKAPHGRVSRADIMCAYHGWQREQDGDEARAFGARAFFPRLRSAAPWTSEMQEHNGRRFITGLHLSDEGLQLWDSHVQGPQLKGGSKGNSLVKTDVNKMIPTAASDTQTDRKEGPNAPRF
jgi:P4 family phage/plasmid primase-like protien